MTMMRKEAAGDYQIGIWSVRREGRRWLAQSGDGSPHYYASLHAAYLALTGEPWGQAESKTRWLRVARVRQVGNQIQFAIYPRWQ